MVIAVLFGGQSHEYPVSLMSVTSVLKNLDTKYEVYTVGITRDGRWYHYSGPAELIEQDSWNTPEYAEEVILSPSPAHHGFYQLKDNTVKRVDLIFPVMHGRNCEDGTIQGLCQLAGIPCLSCNMITSAISIDKVFTHMVCESAGIPMARYLYFHRDNHPSLKQMYSEASTKLGLPFFVKPSREGSSFGAHRIRNEEDFVTYVTDAFQYDDKILLEEFMDGYEVGCGVMGKGEVGEVFEIVVETEMYGFAEKYDGYKTTINVPPKTLTPEQIERVKQLSLKIYNVLDCDGIARVDFFASKKGIIFNETNLIPGFTSHSLYPASFIGAGKTYTGLLNELIDFEMGKHVNE